MPDSYFELVREFPLTHLRSEAELDAAQAVIDRLLQEALDEGGQEYLDALTDLVETFEEQHVPIPDASEADVLRELMRQGGLTQAGLTKEVGIAQSTISAVLNGARTLTRGQVLTLARFFHVQPAVFLPAEKRP
jgi:HTH-type transcriptional regulator/antitoxin HigA